MTSPNNSAFPLMISIVVMDAAQLASVYALLGGTSGLAVAAGNQQRVVQPGDNAGGTGAAPSDAAGQSASGAEASLGAATGDGVNAAAGEGELDAHGHPWSAELHASTKGKTKDGLWRMKVGVTRPDPLPGFPVDNSATGAATGTSSETGTSSATSQDAAGQASGQAATSGPEGEEDEFAAFRAAAQSADAADAAAAAAAPTARNWTDADLGALCNQAAVKLGDPSPIKEIIVQYVPTGEVAHSRNIPADKREDFAKAVEAKAGIEFVG